MNFNLEEILKATNAKVLKNTTNEKNFAFSTDTRTIKKGEIYLPLKGETFDGEKFIENALKKGANGYFTTSDVIFEEADLVLKISNALETYLNLAKFYRNKISPKVIAITGSSGKTTTKEMMASVISEKFKTHKSELNFNNEIGMSKTILSMPADTEVLVLEMGMRGLGEIELLSKHAMPDITVIANVGTAHIGRLKTRENIAKAKCEITKFQKKDGLFVAQDNDLIKNAVNFSGEKRYFSINDVEILKQDVGYSLFDYKNEIYELNIEGEYNIENALGVIEVAKYLGLSYEEIKNGLLKYTPIEKRWDIEEIKGFNIINDSYNANPESMKAVLKTCLNLYKNPLFVLGNMGELGENEKLYHKQIGDFLKKYSNYNLITVGNLAKEIDPDGINFETNGACAKYIVENIKVGTTIIFKASRAMKFEDIIERIKNT